MLNSLADSTNSWAKCLWKEAYVRQRRHADHCGRRDSSSHAPPFSVSPTSSANRVIFQATKVSIHFGKRPNQTKAFMTRLHFEPIGQLLLPHPGFQSFQHQPIVRQTHTLWQRLADLKVRSHQVTEVGQISPVGVQGLGHIQRF